MPYTPTEKDYRQWCALPMMTTRGLKLGRDNQQRRWCVPIRLVIGQSYAAAFGEPYQFEYEFNTGYVADTNEAGTRSSWPASRQNADLAMDGEPR